MKWIGLFGVFYWIANGSEEYKSKIKRDKELDEFRLECDKQRAKMWRLAKDNEKKGQ